MSSRIFVKGLPPSISEDEFKKHFSAKFAITDAKLISHRRIGYVGYQSEEEAAKAVKYFNRSFIRMSRISVETARPVSCSYRLLPKSCLYSLCLGLNQDSSDLGAAKTGSRGFT
jgi:multiple RNA-binding domain-containing protein 1